MALGGIGYNKYYCQFCELFFSGPLALADHVKTCHPVFSKEVIQPKHGDVAMDTAAKWCKICNKWISREFIDDLGHAHFLHGGKDKPYQINEIDKTLAERGKTHGNFEKNADFIQQLKETTHLHRNWSKLSSDAKESIDTIYTKIGRILGGDSEFAEHWHDISGYAKLVEDRLNEKNSGKEKK